MRVRQEGDGHEAVEVQRGKGHFGAGRAGARPGDGGGLPQARDQPCDILQMESEVCWHGRRRGAQAKALETENARLKKLLADAMLDNAVLKDLLGKN